MFGFHVPIYHGKVKVDYAWTSDWSALFTKILSNLFELEIQLNGSWAPYELAFSQLVDEVIPKLLPALQQQGRILKPCLVHGNLCEGNIASNLDTNEPVIFGARGFYAHNEYELESKSIRHEIFNDMCYLNSKYCSRP
ncbi:uncharacterized protein ATNIH1004_008643 [Aspergillus tanneri]|uniref:Protein-ribulosamine 3-kinase n=1 Tax=Aspergillus tanneri TaxID=1220188 RepID=A0A5M9MJ35_9EURO|nr:uncharacterized protein ATNIH1004_008643 [Aspergillus tanneri]KAA8644439.1 hypothetical protein ATNIH1004_008643 [Aspergillus tanneri]